MDMINQLKPRRQHRNKAITPEVEKAIASAVLDAGVSLKQAANEVVGVSEQVAKQAVAKELGKREALASGEAVDLTAFLSKSAQEKLDVAIRYHKHKLDMEYAANRVRDFDRLFKATVLPMEQAKLDEAEQIIKARKGVMTTAQYRTIRACLHPDTLHAIRGPDHVRTPADDKFDARFSEAFRVFESIKIRLLDETQMPTEPVILSREAWEQRKRDVAARRHAERAARSRGTSAPAKGPGSR